MFYQEWFAQGVYSICDILDSSGMYLNFADFCRKFSVLSAIPKRLLERARDSFRQQFNFYSREFHFSLVTVVVDRSI